MTENASSLTSVRLHVEIYGLGMAIHIGFHAGSVVDFFAPGRDVISCATGDGNLNWGINVNAFLPYARSHSINI
jgi:hypothetical protein